MKVVQVNGGDKGGGATNASYRLHHEYLRRGEDSYICAAKTSEPEERIAELPKHSLMERISRRYWARQGLNYVEIRSSYRLQEHEYFRGKPILHFHNIHGGYFNYEALPKLTANEPAVWTLHDMWSFTGHCVYSLDCNRWKSGCGKCPYPGEYPAIKYDATDRELRLKQKVYQNSNLLITSPSQWLADLARTSILKHFDVRTVPNGIDLKVFKPLEKAEIRRELGIQDGRVVLLWGTHQLTDLRKGGDVIVELAKSLPAEFRKRITLLAFGSGTEELAKQLPELDVRPFGFVKTDQQMATVLNAADLLLFPSRADNLPFTIMEALGCGLPTIAFNVGGVPEMVRQELTGLLVSPFDVSEFVHKVIQLSNLPDTLRKMSAACRTVAENEYGIELMADRYLSIYDEIRRTSAVAA